MDKAGEGQKVVGAVCHWLPIFSLEPAQEYWLFASSRVNQYTPYWGKYIVVVRYWQQSGHRNDITDYL